MSDDRDWKQFKKENYISFSEYIKNVLADQPARSEDLRNSIRIFGLDGLENIVAGKRIADIHDLIPGLDMKKRKGSKNG